ncbi:MAG: hypothetical protein DWQ44_09760 [Bacteroidetes bacterium]|nr:MAG: hypothetical protein DWQ33_10035 [Bacteroidota bacterium]REK06569.1 MAG: hypothetical protein DWQ39_03550 [Bacteroidota bacterium]REK33335.1 MAG: hypothetical protein DWQ44_09760 [Bacteroidota bacterium]REK49735.1 MAG: hypothetical protein DWQ48_06315 [Bacteroidota bacterium]
MDKDYNLRILITQFRNKGPAAKGFRSLNKLIKDKNTKYLERLLRNHRDNPITSWEEIEFRDNVDYLLEFYSILFVAIIAGYIDKFLPEKLRHEIIDNLSNEVVKKYYKEYYPLPLLPVFLKYLVPEKVTFKLIQNYENNMEKILFEKFLLINYDIRNDEEINDFLWFLDDGLINDYDADDVVNLLKDRKKIISALSKSDDEGTLKSVITGFIKYLNFLNSYSRLLKQCEIYPYLYTSFYHFQGYWFFRLTKKFGNVISKGLDNINYSLENFSGDEFNEKFVPKENSPIRDQFISNFSYEKWKEKSKKEILETEQNINYLKHAQIRLSKLETAFL